MRDKKINFNEFDDIIRDLLPKALSKIVYDYYNNFCIKCNNEMVTCYDCKKYFCMNGHCPRCFCMCVSKKCISGVCVFPIDCSDTVFLLYTNNEQEGFLHHSHISTCFYKTCLTCFYKTCINHFSSLFCYRCYYKKII